MIADHFLFKEGDRFLDACGLNRDWPEGRGIFHNNAKTFLVWVNEEDQLRIISMQQGADIGEVFTRLSKAAAHIETVARFAHDEHLGYITSCPTNLGTALRASVHIALPKLGARMEEFQKIADEYNVQIRGIHGEHSESADHVYDISNKRRLGISEVNLVQDMYSGVKAMIAREKELGGGAPAPSDDQPPQLPADLQRDIDAQAEDGYIQWRDNSTPEQKATGSAEIEKWKDPAYAESEMKMMSDAFTQSDANKDGLLNPQEFDAFMAELMRIGAAKGNYEDPRPETPGKWYVLANRITPNVEGVTLQDF